MFVLFFTLRKFHNVFLRMHWPELHTTFQMWPDDRLIYQGSVICYYMQFYFQFFFLLNAHWKLLFLKLRPYTVSTFSVTKTLQLQSTSCLRVHHMHQYMPRRGLLAPMDIIVRLLTLNLICYFNAHFTRSERSLISSLQRVTMRYVH